MCCPELGTAKHLVHHRVVGARRHRFHARVEAVYRCGERRDTPRPAGRSAPSPRSAGTAQLIRDALTSPRGAKTHSRKKPPTRVFPRAHPTFNIVHTQNSRSEDPSSRSESFHTHADDEYSSGRRAADASIYVDCSQCSRTFRHKNQIGRPVLEARLVMPHLATPPLIL